MKREEFLELLPELARKYQPSRDVVENIANVRLLMIVGPSGVGKTVLMNKLSIPFVPSDTTRPQRPGELDGVDYYFHDDYDTLAHDLINGHFLQVVIGVGGDLYATRGSSYPKNSIGVMAVVADVVPFFRELGFEKTISAFITPPSFEEWQRRLQTHHLSDDQLKKRLVEGKRSLTFALNDKQTHMILNDDLGSATTQLNQLVEGKINKRMEKVAKNAALNILNRLD